MPVLKKQNGSILSHKNLNNLKICNRAKLREFSAGFEPRTGQSLWQGDKNNVREM